MQQPRPPLDCPARVTVSPWKHLRANVPGLWGKAIERCHSDSDPAIPLPLTRAGGPATWVYRPSRGTRAAKKEFPRHTREQPRRSPRYLLKRCIAQFLRKVLRAEWNGRLRAVLQGAEYSFLAAPSSRRERELQRALVECSCCCPIVGRLLAAGDDELLH